MGIANYSTAVTEKLVAIVAYLRRLPAKWSVLWIILGGLPSHV